MTPKRILHCHSTFDLGGKEARAVRLMNAFGDAAEHTIISADPEAMGARSAIDPQTSVVFPFEAPPLNGRPSIGRYRALARYMVGFDLILTYNWGAMDAVAAHSLFVRNGPPLIHHEDGFNADEAERLKWRRTVFRQIFLGTAKTVVVPSHTLEAIAAFWWKRPDVVRIPNGIDVAAYARPESGSIPGLVRRPDEVIVGTVAGLRPVKNLPRLVRVVASVPSARLVIVGEGPERARIEAEARAVGLANRLHLAGFLRDPRRYVGLFDIFALSSDSEQAPISLIEAMAAGLPVVATEVGDIASMVAEANRPYIVPARDEAAFARAIEQLAADPATRAHLGEANKARASAEFDETAMIARYRSLYFGEPAART